MQQHYKTQALGQGLALHLALGQALVPKSNTKWAKPWPKAWGLVVRCAAGVYAAGICGRYGCAARFGAGVSVRHSEYAMGRA